MVNADRPARRVVATLHRSEPRRSRAITEPPLAPPDFMAHADVDLRYGGNGSMGNTDSGLYRVTYLPTVGREPYQAVSDRRQRSMDTTQRREAGRLRVAGRAALSYWRYGIVGIFCLAYDWVFLHFWLSVDCLATGSCIGPTQRDAAGGTVLGTGILLIVGAVAVGFACRRRPDRRNGTGPAGIPDTDCD